MIKAHLVMALESRPQLIALCYALRRQFRIRHIMALGLDGMVSLPVPDDMEEWRHLVDLRSVSVFEGLRARDDSANSCGDGDYLQ